MKLKSYLKVMQGKALDYSRMQIYNKIREQVIHLSPRSLRETNEITAKSFQ